MKLLFGKTGSIELEPVPITSEVRRGVRTFRSTGPGTGRAAVLANAAAVHVFEKAVPSFATQADRAAVGADKVDTAVFRDPSGAFRLVYREVVVRYEPGISATRKKAVLNRFGLRVRARNSFHEDQLIAYHPKRRYVAERMIELSNKLTETDEVAFAFPNFVSEFKRVATPTPIKEQWHLDVIEVRKAWAASLGKGITVAVLDDGVDIDHPNLKGNILKKPDPSEPLDRFGRDFFVGEDAPDHFDPRPKRFQAPFDEMPGNDIHGTSCAGVAAASGSVNGFRGAAPEARILPVKIFHADDLAVEARVADAIRYASRFADILSCSWSGPASPDVEAALEDAGAGRGGKGCPVFCATGNDSAARIGFPARLRSAIGVGASTDKERRADYSNFGPEISIVAPSNGGTRAISTTDVSFPNRGFNLGTAAAGGADGLHTNAFGGTSSATPLAAGVAALVLSVNPKLTRDEVRDVLQDTADKIGPKSAYKANGHSREFGFGRINAAQAIARAQQLAVAKQAVPKAKVAKQAASKGKVAKARRRRAA